MRLTPSISIMKRQRLLNPRNLEVARRMAVMTPGAFRIIRKGRGLSATTSRSSWACQSPRSRSWSAAFASFRTRWPASSMPSAADPRNEPKAEP